MEIRNWQKFLILISKGGGLWGGSKVQSWEVYLGEG